MIPADYHEECRREIDRLRAELASRVQAVNMLDQWCQEAIERAEKAEAAIARVRELCGGPYAPSEVFRALDGAE